MKKLLLQRLETGDDGTFGSLMFEDGDLSFTCATAELPWRENRTGRSCIPSGTYVCAQGPSSKGNRYRLRSVPRRDGILIHAGNFAGDVDKGLKSNVQGCIILGLRRGNMAGQRAVMDSQRAMTAFEAIMGGQPFELEVRDI